MSTAGRQNVFIIDLMLQGSSEHAVRQLEAHLQPTVGTMAMQIIAIMARLTSVGGGFVQLTASDDTVRARSVAASHARPRRPLLTCCDNHLDIDPTP